MNAVTAHLYRILVPKFIRRKIVARRLPKAILDYYAGLSGLLSPEISPALAYLKQNPLTVFPYDFEKEYKEEVIEVFRDNERGLRYVMQEGKKLYFKRRWGTKKIRSLYNLLSQEQDPRSPHRYLAGTFRFEEGEVLVDVGAAEGNFALSVIEKASRVVLFEADPEWLEPLEATFQPWKDKVLIINKFVSDRTRSQEIRLDDSLLSVQAGIFLKIDVEGAETRVLRGASQLLNSQHPLKVALCTYHHQEDEKEFTSLLNHYGFETVPSEGYMLYYFDKKIGPPYFRRGLLRASRN